MNVTELNIPSLLYHTLILHFGACLLIYSTVFLYDTYLRFLRGLSAAYGAKFKTGVSWFRIFTTLSETKLG